MHAGRSGQETGNALQSEETTLEVTLLHVHRSVKAVQVIEIAVIGGGGVAAVRVFAGTLRLQGGQIGMGRRLRYGWWL